jgi:coiled-coil domain-containing protein 130
MQGFNMGRYVPPEHEGVLSGNRLNRKNALGNRASKQRTTGELTVRFEMPFAIWCTTCPKPTIIGQGVRFNAAKRRVGNYHSTPIWAFRMRHAVCGGEIEIRTDPKNTEYVVAEGGRRRDTGAERHAGDSLVGDGEFRLETREEHDAAREGAFKRLEKTIADREASKWARDRIEGLEDVAERQWDDPYTRNQKLRAAFRVGRKQREKDAHDAETLKDKMSLDIDLLAATPEDARRAALISFGTADVEGDLNVQKALAKPLFGQSVPPVPTTPPERTSSSKAPNGRSVYSKETARLKHRHTLITEITGNTRAVHDPFLDSAQKRRTPAPKLLGVKRKRDVQEAPDHPSDGSAGASVSVGGLVTYNSDSD